MKLSDLSASTGVAPATLKYYLREGLLPAGARVSATRADYDASHVERVRLIRALVEGAGLSIAGVRRVVDAIEHPPESFQDFLGAAQSAISVGALTSPVSPEVRYAVAELGWGDCHSDALGLLQAALDTADRASFPVTTERLVAYGRAMEQVAEIDIGALAADTAGASRSEMLRYVAVGTVVVDPVLVALRRLAQAHVSAARLGLPPPPP